MSWLRVGSEINVKTLIFVFMVYPNKIQILFFCFLLLPSIIFSQEEKLTDIERPKIGLVLSGGGAKGIAHVGVLKAMEKEGIRPDYITGTSMGSIIGGLYALGYTADQLDTIIRQIDWGEVLSNNIQLQYIAYEEKEYYNRYLIELPFKDGKPKLPSGVIHGQMLGEMLARYCWPAKNYATFDEFPIPFRCIATDVSTGKEIVFKDGSLAMALRASMAIPTAFTPVELDSTLAVDGGVVNNFPVDEVINMGADIVIGVSVGDGLIPAKELNGMTDILFQISMIPSLTILQDQIDKCDIYIRPDLKDNGTASFSNFKEILELGDAAGQQFRPKFKKLAESSGVKTQVLPDPPPLIPDSIYIGEITLTGNRMVSGGLISSKLQIEVGDKVSRHDIETGVRTIYGINNFEKVVYRLHKLSSENTYGLTIKTIEKKPVVLKGSVHYDNIFKIGVVLNITLRNLLGKSSRTIVAGDISENPKFRLDYLKYIGLRQKIALDIRYDYLTEKIPSYESGKVQDVDISYEHNFSIGGITTQSLRNSLFFGTTYQINKQKQKFNSIIPEGVKHGNFNNMKAEVLFTANTFNDRNYPTNGRELSVGGELYFYNNYSITYENNADTVYFQGIPLSEQDFNQYYIEPLIPDLYGLVELKFSRFYQIRPKFQIVPMLSTGVTLATVSDALFQSYRIGGNQRVKYSDKRFIGLNYAEADWNNYANIGLFFQNVLFQKVYLKYGANYLLPYEYVPLTDLDTFSFDTLIDDNSVLGYGIELTYKSFLGPISLGVSRNSRDSAYRYYFAVGFSFKYSD